MNMNDGTFKPSRVPVSILYCICYVFPWIKIVWTWTWIITIQYIQQCVGVYGVNVLVTRHSIHFLADTSHNHTLTPSCYILSMIRSYIRLHSHWYQSYTNLTRDSSNHSPSSNLHRRRPTTTIHSTIQWHRYDINTDISYISTTITMITIIAMCHLPIHTIYTAITDYLQMTQKLRMIAFNQRQIKRHLP